MPNRQPSEPKRCEKCGGAYTGDECPMGCHGVVAALRQAMADLGACAVAFEKIGEGTEMTPIHCRVADARRAYARVQTALRLHDTKQRARRHIAEDAEILEALGDG